MSNVIPGIDLSRFLIGFDLVQKAVIAIGQHGIFGFQLKAVFLFFVGSSWPLSSG